MKLYAFSSLITGPSLSNEWCEFLKIVNPKFVLLFAFKNRSLHGSAGVQLSNSPIRMWIGELEKLIFSGSMKHGG